jgi:hypothetical protein
MTLYPIFFKAKVFFNMGFLTVFFAGEFSIPNIVDELLLLLLLLLFDS